MTIYKRYAATINKAIRLGYTIMYREDCERYLENGYSQTSSNILSALGCEIWHLADLYEVRLPAHTITKQEVRLVELINNAR